jgi:3-dehydroquinate dehydratase
MARAQEYRRYAADCFKLAQQAQNPTDKARLLQMAQAWNELAEKITATEADDKQDKT